MAKRLVHRILELTVGVLLLLFGGLCISADIDAYRWIMGDPDHRWGFFGIGTTIGILPFVMGGWLVFVAVLRLCSRNTVNPRGKSG